MNDIHPMKQWRVRNVCEEPLRDDVYVPFAAEELEIAKVGAGAPPLLHLWRHEKALVLGLRDRRLPGAAAAMQQFAAEGWSAAVRNSGGAAVPLSAGVINVTLVLPSKPGAMRIHDDFAVMAALIRRTVSRFAADARVQIGEVTGAYCPGEYDVGIGGRKFCGIAQRRRLGGYALQAFVVVEGDGRELALEAARFYELAGSSKAPGLHVSEQSAASLQQLLGPHVTVQQFGEAFLQEALSGAVITETMRDYNDLGHSALNDMINLMRRRYDVD